VSGLTVIQLVIWLFGWLGWVGLGLGLGCAGLVWFGLVLT